MLPALVSRLACLLHAWAMLVICPMAVAQTRPSVTRLESDSARSFLWVGNSYTVGLDSELAGFLQKAAP